MNYLNLTIKGIAFLFISLSILCYNATFAQSTSIAYDLGDGDISLLSAKNNQYTYDASASPNVRNFIRSGIGVGLDVRLPILYMLLHKQEHRLRIADDFGFGTYLCSNNLTVKNPLTNTTMDKSNYVEAMVSVGVTIHYGIQAVYRVNDKVDIGAKWLPLFGTDGAHVTNIGTTLGLHLRINQFYIDYRTTPSASYTRYPTRADKKAAENSFESNGLHNLCVKYSVPNARHHGYIFTSINSYAYQLTDFYANAKAFTPAGYENYTLQKNRAFIVRIGVGWMLDNE
jgi:hypothetical protein